MPPIDTEFHIDDPQGFDLAAIDADSLSGVRLELVLEKTGMSAEKVFADARPLATSVTQCGANFSINLSKDLGLVSWFSFCGDI